MNNLGVNHHGQNDGWCLGSSAVQPSQGQNDDRSDVHRTRDNPERQEERMVLGTPSPEGSPKRQEEQMELSPEGSPKSGDYIPAMGNIQEQHRAPNTAIRKKYALVVQPATPLPAEGHHWLPFPCMDILGSEEADRRLRRRVFDIKGKILHIGGVTMTSEDLETLFHPNWLGGKVINAYMNLLVANRRSFAIPTFITQMWDMDDIHLDALKLHLDVSEARFTHSVVNVRSCHWVLLVAENQEKLISFVDSSPVSEDKMKWISNWRRFVEKRNLKLGKPLEEWKEGAIVSSKQTDNDSCGPFVLMNAFTIEHGSDLSVLTTEHAVIFRRFVLTLLLCEDGYTLGLPLKCSWRGCKINSLDQEYCVRCKRWRHSEHWERPRRTEGFICGECV